MKKNRKAAGTNSSNSDEFAGGKIQDFEFDFAISEGKLQSNITSLISTKQRRVIKLLPCGGCKKHYVPAKMSPIPKCCWSCLDKAQTKTPSERRRFAATILNNCSKFIKGFLAL